MTQKQKAARDKFKKVVAEAGKLRKKNPSLTQAQAVKQAWAISYSKAGITKKAAAPKKKSASKKIGALPNSFKGAIMDIPFKVYHQYDIYGDVTSIIEDTENKNTIAKIDGKGTAKDKSESFYNYLSKYSKWDKKDYAPSLKGKLNKFVSNLHQEVKDFNAGRKKTIKAMPIKIDEPKKKIVKSNPTKSAKSKIAKSVKKQKGLTDKNRDILFQAKKPGKRKTAWGTTYYENRANRSDKGVLLGINDDILKELKSIQQREIYFSDLLQKQLFEEASLKSQTKGKSAGIAKAQLIATRRYIKDLKNILMRLKKQKMALKKDIK